MELGRLAQELLNRTIGDVTVVSHGDRELDPFWEGTLSG